MKIQVFSPEDSSAFSLAAFRGMRLEVVKGSVRLSNGKILKPRGTYEIESGNLSVSRYGPGEAKIRLG